MENKIKIYRTVKGYTQEQLADELKCTRQTINAIEKGKYSPSLELAFKLANTLDIKVDELFIYKEDIKKTD